MKKISNFIGNIKGKTGLDPKVNSIKIINGKEYITYTSPLTGKTTILGTQPPLNLCSRTNYNTSKTVDVKEFNERFCNYFSIDIDELENIMKRKIGQINNHGEKIDFKRFCESFSFCQDQKKNGFGFFIWSLDQDMTQYRKKTFAVNKKNEEEQAKNSKKREYDKQKQDDYDETKKHNDYVNSYIEQLKMHDIKSYNQKYNEAKQQIIIELNKSILYQKHNIFNEKFILTQHIHNKIVDMLER